MVMSVRTLATSIIPASMALAMLAAVPALGDWPMFRGDAARSGTAPDEGFAGFEVAWTADLGGSVDSSPAVVGEMVFVGNSLGAMHALSAADGAVVWRFETDGAVVSSPAVAEGAVVFGSVDGFFYAVDSGTGEQLWRFRTRGPILSSPAIADGRVVFGSMDGRMYCLSLAEGSLIWRSDAGAGIQSSPAIADGRVLYGDNDGAMRSLNLTDGSVAWEHDGRGRVIAAPVAHDAVVVFGVMGPSALRPPKVDYLVALRADTGERLWAQNDSYSVLGAPVIGGDHVFLVTIEGYVSKTVARAARLADGEELWDRTLAGVVDSSPVLTGSPEGFDGGLSGMGVIFGCHDGRLYLLDAETGRVSGVQSLADKVYSSPAVVAGRLFIGANDGRLHCLTAPE